MEKKTSERFNKATDALYNAFFNGTLAKGNCLKCAVGNIVSSCLGAVNENDAYEKGAWKWKRLFYTNEKGQQNPKNNYLENAITEALKIISYTGYTEDELAKIEYAFETNTKINHEDYFQYSTQETLEDQYNGLVAVFDVLLELEGIENNGHKEKLKTHPKLELQN